MRVLAVNKFYYLKGGSETYYFSLNRLLSNAGVEVVPFSMKDPKNLPNSYEKYFLDSIDFFNASFFKRLKQLLNIIYSFYAREKISHIIEDYGPELAHLHVFQHQFSPSILKEIKKYGIPVINTVHDLKPLCPNYMMFNKGKVCEKCFKHRYYQCFINRCVKGSYAASLVTTIEMYLHDFLGSYDNVDMFITPSRFYRQKFIEYGYPEERVVHIPNFIDTQRYKPQYDGGSYILYFGRLSSEKGIITLLNAVRNMGEELLIAGDGPFKSELVTCIEEKKIDNVRLLGFKEGEELVSLIKNSRFTVIPSEWYENCPLSVLESMAYGKPVIGADIGGIPELVENKKTGLVFKPGSSDDLAEKISYMLGNPGVVTAMGKEARIKVETEFNKGLHLERIMNIYKSMLNYG